MWVTPATTSERSGPCGMLLDPKAVDPPRMQIDIEDVSLDVFMTLLQYLYMDTVEVPRTSE